MIAYKKFYHCKLKQDRKTPTLKEYEKPILKWGNYQPLSGYVDTVLYGKSIQGKWRLSMPYNGNENEYSIGDLLYLDGATPIEDDEYENGDGANAVISAINIGYKLILIEIDRIIPKV